MDMKSWTEPDYSSVKWLTQTGRTGVGANESIDEGNVNEGPFMIYHDGYYYLTTQNALKFNHKTEYNGKEFY